MQFILNIVRGSESGQALAEYALLLGVLCMGCLVALIALGPAITQPFDDFIAGISP